MKVLCRLLIDWWRTLIATWDAFWFTPVDTATLGLMRILVGLMLFYTHLVWSLDLMAFMGTDAWVSTDLIRATWSQEGRTVYAWTHFAWIESPLVLWSLHLAALIVFAFLTVGLYSRTSAVAAFLLTVSYIHRATGAVFGLDQINVMLAMYMMIGPCGDSYSLDSLLRRKRGVTAGNSAAGIAANIAIRLCQVHLCVIYFFAGTRKLMGQSWWDGQAIWLSVANLEYQSVDLTWLAGWPGVVALLTHLAVFFEVSYAALIWPRLSRPVVLLMAVFLHLGIAICMGMATFGLAMLIGNLAFVSPVVVRSFIDTRMPGRP